VVAKTVGTELVAILAKFAVESSVGFNSASALFNWFFVRNLSGSCPLPISSSQKAILLVLPNLYRILAFLGIEIGID